MPFSLSHLISPNFTAVFKIYSVKGGAKFFFKFYLFLAALGLRCCAWAFSSSGERGLLFVACADFSLRWLLLLQITGSRRVGFSSCGMRAQ